jgi:hypothetical protein
MTRQGNTMTQDEVSLNKDGGSLMLPITQTDSVSKGQMWAGRITRGVCTAFLLFDGAIKLLKAAPVVEAQSRLQIPEGLTLVIGILVLVCTAAYMIPRTAILGAILLTGYLGGAVAIQLRIGADLFSLLFPVIFATLAWGGLYLGDSRLRALVPLRR